MTEQDCLAIMWAILLLRLYLYGKHFEVRRDHGSLRWMMNIETPSRRLSQWNLRLQEFDYDVIYRPCIKHLSPNGLSRLDTYGHDESELDDYIPAITLTKAEEKTLETFNEDDFPS